MSIDWLTVTAQLMNFLILVWLLKRYLYRPILDGIDAREQEIAIRMSEAASIEAKADGKRREYQQKIDLLREQSSDTQARVRAAAERERDCILDEVRERIKHEQRAAQHQRKNQAEQFVRELNDQGGKVLLSMTQKVLKDLSDEALEERLVVHALSTLHQNGFNQSTDLTSSNSQLTAQVSTQVPLSTECQSRITTSVATRWPEITLAFTNNSEQSPGALVQLGSTQVDWTIDTYFDDLADALTQQLTHRIEPTG